MIYVYVWRDKTSVAEPRTESFMNILHQSFEKISALKIESLKNLANIFQILAKKL